MRQFVRSKALKATVGAAAAMLVASACSSATGAAGHAAGKAATPRHAHRHTGGTGRVTGSTAGRLKVCTTGDYEPLTSRDPKTGRYRGIDIDMARNLASYLHRRVQFVPTSWAALSRDVATRGRCDIAVGGISVTAERRRAADFTDPVLTTGKTPVTTTADRKRFRTVEDIDKPGVDLIVDSGGQNQKYAEHAFPKASLTVWSDNTTVFGELLNGHAEVFVTDSVEAEYQARKNPRLAAVHPDRPFTTDHKAYMLPKNSPLTGRADTWLKKVLHDGTFRRYRDSWLKD